MKHILIFKWSKICGLSDKDRVDVLLAHNPKDFETYSTWGADLVFSGHTHGGMIRIFDRGIISTDRTLFPEYDGGVFTVNRDGAVDTDYIIQKENSDIISYDENKMIVSRGLSRGHVGFRLFNRPELVEIEFKK